MSSTDSKEVTTKTTNESQPEKPTDPLADIPPVSTYLATTPEDKVAALKLIADSVAQQRQLASRAIITQPYIQAAVMVLLAIVSSFMVSTNHWSEWALFGTTSAGIIMALLIGVRAAVSGYLTLAESVTWNWLSGDEVVITKFGEQVIGAAVVGMEEGESKKGKKKKGGKGVVRAWTVLLRYRGKGEGRVLLEEVVKIVKEKGGEGVVFDKEGIYTQRKLPALFNKKFDERDKKAEKALNHVLDDKWSQAKRK